jgi:hypothetical protein
MSSPLRVLLPAAAAFALLLGACGTKSSEDPAKALQNAGKAMAQVNTVSADLSFGKGAKSFGLGLVGGTASVRVPGDTKSEIKARSGDSVLQFGIISVGGQTYIRVPLLGWQAASAGEAANLPDFSRLLDRTAGLPGTIGAGTGPHLDATEQVDGQDCYKITATYTPAQVQQVITILVPEGNVQGTFWVDVNNHYVRRARMAGKLFEKGVESSFEVHMHDFNGKLDITKPV